MNNIIIDTLVNKEKRYADLKRMSEQEEALVRSQAMLMLDRNVGNHHIHKRVLQRFKKCVR